MPDSSGSAVFSLIHCSRFPLWKADFFISLRICQNGQKAESSAGIRLKISEILLTDRYQTRSDNFMNRKAFGLIMSAVLLAGCSAAQSESDSQKLSIIELVPENDKVIVNEKSDIEIRTDPSDEVLSAADFDASGAKIDVKDHTAVFSADKTGSYKIQASKDGIESNPVTIEVVNEAGSSSSDQNGFKNSNADQNEKNNSGEQSAQPAASSENSKTAQQQTEPAQPADTQKQAQTTADKNTASETNASLTGAISMDEFYQNPDSYVNQKVTINGYTPQNLPPEKEAVLDNGQKLDVIFNRDSTEGLPVMNEDDSQLAPYIQLTGIIRKQNIGPYQYVLDVSKTTALSPKGSAYPTPTVSVGSPASDLPSKGTFTFSVDDVIIRNGKDGKESPASGYVYRSGMSVHYDGVYQKDGYTWITYTGQSGKLHSVAVGTDQTIEYGYAIGS